MAAGCSPLSPRRGQGGDRALAQRIPKLTTDRAFTFLSACKISRSLVNPLCNAQSLLMQVRIQRSISSGQITSSMFVLRMSSSKCRVRGKFYPKMLWEYSMVSFDSTVSGNARFRPSQKRSTRDIFSNVSVSIRSTHSR
jgi:hypothetical protein